jgi:hypothetical protein
MEKMIQIFAVLLAVALIVFFTIPMMTHSLDIVYKYWR